MALARGRAGCAGGGAGMARASRRASVCMRPRPSGRSPRSIASWSRAPSTSLTPRPSRRVSSPRPAPTSTPRCSPRYVRCRVQSMAARAIVSNRCSRKSTRGRGWRNAWPAFSVKWRLPPGFGHAIYPAGDPRAVLLEERGRRDCAPCAARRLFETALRIEETVLAARAAASESRLLSDRLRPDAGVCARSAGRDFRCRPRRADGSRTASSNTPITGSSARECAIEAVPMRHWT